MFADAGARRAVNCASPSGTIRRARPSDRAELGALMDRAFRLPLAEQIGPFLGEARIGDHWVIEDDGRLVSAIGFYPHRFRWGGVEFEVAAVGQVCTDPERRGGGHMTALLRHILPLADACDFVWLDGDRLRYGRYGWAPGGLRYGFGFGARNLPAPPPADAVEVCDVADCAADLAAALESAPQALLFAPGETAALFRAGRGRDFRVARLGRSRIAFNRAGDTVVHGEGDEAELALLLSARLAARTAAAPAGSKPGLEAFCGPDPSPWLDCCSRRFAWVWRTVSDSFRVGALERFCRRACRAAQPRVSAGDGALALRNADNGQTVVLECRGGRLSARAARPDEPCRELTTQQLSEFFFGVCPPETVLPDYPPDSPFRRVFPLPLCTSKLVSL